MSLEDEVMAASKNFYAALNQTVSGKPGTMKDVWSNSAEASSMHPIGGREVGWDAVAQSFDQFAQLASDGQVTLDDQIIQVAGDTAYEMGIERGRLSLGGKAVTFESRVTNIYRRETDGWKIVHHHTDLTPSVVDVLNSVSA